MTSCKNVERWLLECDIGELSPVLNVEVAQHLAICALCSARRNRVVNDSARLALFGTRRGVRAAVFAGTAAVLLAASLVVLLFRHDGARPRGSSVVALAPATAVAPRAAAAIAHNTKEPSVRASVRVSHAERPQQRSTKTTSISHAPVDAGASDISVEPSGAERVAVLRGADPRVTVVWFY